jgi:hypothetical protein
MNAYKVSSRFLPRGGYKKMHTHENFENYDVLEMVAVKFVYYWYHFSN